MDFINKESVIHLLGELIKIYSPYLEENEIMDFVYNYMLENNLDAKLQHYEENEILKYKGKNVIGSLKGRKEGKTIYVNGHLDTVQICNGWETDPLEPVVKDNKLYGLGSLDMKSGVVALILAIKQFKKDFKDFNGEIIYSFVSDEEGPFGLGTDSVINEKIADKADVAIITEPSSGFSNIDFPCLSLGARGGFSYKVEFYGKAAHGANPEKGINAILDASKFALELKNHKLESDKRLGSGSNCIVEMNGGGATCSVADYSYIKVFRHINMNENKDTIIEEIKAVIKKANIKSDYEIKFRKSPSKDTEGFLPYLFDKEDENVMDFISSIKNITDSELSINYFSSIGDFNYIGSRLNIPTLVFGPNGKNYHSSNEYVLIDSVVNTSKVIYDYFVRLLVK